jgi:hypothetical protein
MPTKLVKKVERIELEINLEDTSSVTKEDVKELLEKIAKAVADYYTEGLNILDTEDGQTDVWWKINFIKEAKSNAVLNIEKRCPKRIHTKKEGE